MNTNNTQLPRFPSHKERKAINAANDISVYVNFEKDRWALKKVELDLMEACAD